MMTKKTKNPTAKPLADTNIHFFQCLSNPGGLLSTYISTGDTLKRVTPEPPANLKDEILQTCRCCGFTAPTSTFETNNGICISCLK